jgi:hypothetical protein
VVEVLVVVQDPDRYRALIDQWRGAATVVQELPPQVALATLRSADPPDVPGTRWYSGAVPADVLLRLDPAARLFVAAWRDRQQLKRDGPGGGNVHWTVTGD